TGVEFAFRIEEALGARLCPIHDRRVNPGLHGAVFESRVCHGRCYPKSSDYHVPESAPPHLVRVLRAPFQIAGTPNGAVWPNAAILRLQWENQTVASSLPRRWHISGS